MFLLHFLPDGYLLLAVNGILLVGAVGIILSVCSVFLRFLIPYTPTIKLVSAILLIAGSYFKGGYSVEMEWRNRVNEMQKRIEQAEEKARTATAKIETVLVEKVKIVKEKVNENKKAIKANKEIIDAECRIPDVARVLYNRAVTHDISRSTTNVNDTGTEFKRVNIK
mgnify:CR=1 FL=1